MRDVKLEPALHVRDLQHAIEITKVAASITFSQAGTQRRHCEGRSTIVQSGLQQGVAAGEVVSMRQRYRNVRGQEGARVIGVAKFMPDGGDHYEGFGMRQYDSLGITVMVRAGTRGLSQEDGFRPVLQQSREVNRCRKSVPP